jgi:hypothetical protein
VQDGYGRGFPGQEKSEDIGGDAKTRQIRMSPTFLYSTYARYRYQLCKAGLLREIETLVWTRRNIGVFPRARKKNFEAFQKS